MQKPNVFNLMFFKATDFKLIITKKTDPNYQAKILYLEISLDKRGKNIY